MPAICCCDERRGRRDVLCDALSSTPVNSDCDEHGGVGVGGGGEGRSQHIAPVHGDSDIDNQQATTQSTYLCTY